MSSNNEQQTPVVPTTPGTAISGLSANTPLPTSTPGGPTVPNIDYDDPVQHKAHCDALIDHHLQQLTFERPNVTTKSLDITKVEGLHHSSGGWTTFIKEVTGPEAKIYGDGGSISFDSKHNVSNSLKTESNFIQKINSTTLDTKASVSRQLSILFASLQDKGCRLAAYTRGYCAVIYDSGSVYYDYILESIIQDIQQMPNSHFKGGKGACIPIDKSLMTIGADAVARWNRFEQQARARLKLRPEYDPAGTSFDPANAVSFAEYSSACHFVASKLRLWLQRSRHGLPPIPSETLLTDGTGFISTNNEVYLS